MPQPVGQTTGPENDESRNNHTGVVDMGHFASFVAQETDAGIQSVKLNFPARPVDRYGKLRVNFLIFADGGGPEVPEADRAVHDFVVDFRTRFPRATLELFEMTPDSVHGGLEHYNYKVPLQDLQAAADADGQIALSFPGQ